jgi:pimeloyl-ACP methyl ester carboxylesterase
MVKKVVLKGNGKQINALESGDPDNERAILFFHGFPDDAQSFNKQQEYFSKDFYCLAPHLKGVTKEEGKDFSFTFESQVEFIDIIFEFLKGKKVWVVAHDIGGIPTDFLVFRSSNQIEGVIFVNSLFIQLFAEQLKNTKQGLKSWYMLPFQVPFLDRAFWRLMSFGYSRVNKEFRDRITKEKQTEFLLPFYRMAFNQMLQKTNGTKLKKPLFVLHAKKDPFLLPPHEDSLKKCSEQYEVELVEGGHWVHQTNPQLINESIERWMKKVF